MNILLDTHIALWAIADDPKLSEHAKNLISDEDNNIYYSAVSVWEVLLKNQSLSNNLHLTPDDFIQYCNESGYYPLNLCEKHIVEASILDIKEADAVGHRDPFDRILIAQAKSEHYNLITHDPKMKLYHEKCVIEV